MAVVALLDPEAAVAPQVRWALWFGQARREPVTLLLSAERQEMATAQARAVVEQHEGFRFVEAGEGGGDGGDKKPAPATPSDAAGDAEEPEDPRQRCRVLVVDDEQPAALVARISEAMPDLFVVLLQKLDSKDERALRLGRDVLPQVGCSVALVRLGDEEQQRWPLTHLMVAASRGSHPRAAVRFAQQLAETCEGRLTGVYVEPDIGSYANDVGENVLRRVLRSSLEKPDDVRRHVVIDGAVDAGLERAAKDLEPDAVVLAMPHPGLLVARFWALVPAKLSRRVAQPVVILRSPLPLGNRLRRALEELLQRYVPQVERETRVELATRVQSSSAWNFDFVALISMSSVIAAFGLLQDSAAVIIGAMLIAPLMTPILGVGLALAQGNVMLLKMAFRSIFYGVGTAFALAALVGVADGLTHPSAIVSDEMLARGWPGIIDLLIAFVSGLAVGYAHSRPGLVAALPGVAIAAALVPPIATSGLAFAGGEFELAYGSFLLFFANMVAIVLAAGLSLWMVGVRKPREKDWLRHVGNGLIVVTLALTVYLTQRPHLGASVLLDDDVRGNVARQLPDSLRLIDLGARRGDGEVVVIVRVGGTAPPAPTLAAELLPLVDRLVDGRVSLRVTYEWESRAERPAPRRGD